MHHLGTPAALGRLSQAANRLGWQEGAKNHGNTFPAGNVTQTVGYEPITGTALDVPAAVTQPVTLSLLHKSRHAGECVTVLMLGTSLFNSLGVKGNFARFCQPNRGALLLLQQD
jgi:hypothetical protein